MKKLFLLFTLAFVAMSCEMIDEKLDDFIGRDDSSVTTIANNQIWYTSTDGEIVKPYNQTAFNVSIVSNIYENGHGIISFDGDVTTIGNFAFSRCRSLESVTIPDSVTEIGNSAFYYCYSLTSVTIPDSVTTIGDYAFYNCSSLESITIPDSVTTIGEGAFVGCSSLQEFNGKFASEDGRCLIIDGVLNSFAIGCSAMEYTIPDGVTTIGGCAFAYCDSLTSVTIPDSVTTIGDYAFYDCYSLTSVTIGDSVTMIGDYAFSNCSSLTSVAIPDSVTTIGEGAFRYCSSLQEFNGKFASEDGRCLIIDGVLNSFAIGCGATEYTIHDSVTMIGDYAFSNCSSLASVTIPDSVTTIGEWTFSDCSSLTSVTIGNSVTEIGFFAFYQCDSLTSVTIPDSVTEIGYWAFYDCVSLTSVYCKPTTPPAGDDYMFYDNAPSRQIYVPMESVEAYKSASYWSEYADDIVGYNF